MNLLEKIFGKKNETFEKEEVKFSNIKVRKPYSDKIRRETTGNNEVSMKIPQFVFLTQEEIDDIHARGKITQEEKVREWESLGLCVPGNNIGSAIDRCRKFQGDCHECLVDYSLQSIEYDSFYNNFKIISLDKENDVAKKKIRKKS